MSSNKCSNCATFNYDCTYIEAAKACSGLYNVHRIPLISGTQKRPSKEYAYLHPCHYRYLRQFQRYVEGLENRLEHMEKLLRKVLAAILT